jgi:two-component system CheB/CheR fusion protein
LLATNATKYGSLSEPKGRVEVKWVIEGNTFTFSWIERDGPPVHEPTSQGFVSHLISAALWENPRIVYAKEGLGYSISLPLEHVCKGS